MSILIQRSPKSYSRGSRVFSIILENEKTEKSERKTLYTKDLERITNYVLID